MAHTTTVKVATYGVDWRYDAPIPHKLTDLIDVLQSVLERIPAEFRDTAEVDCGPDYEYGESYEAIRITFERPATPEEVEQQLSADREHWTQQLKQAQERIAYCESQLATRQLVAPQQDGGDEW